MIPDAEFPDAMAHAAAASLCLYLHPGKSGLAPHMALLLAGARFELRFVDLPNGEQQTPAFLALNPFGTIPVLTDGDRVVTETGAILLHIAERFPDSALLPASGPERAGTLRRLFHAAALHAEFMMWHRSGSALANAPDSQESVRAWMGERLAAAFRAADALFAQAPLAASAPDIADLYWLMVAGWWRTRFDFAHETLRLAGRLQATADHPCVQATYSAQERQPPRFLPSSIACPDRRPA